MIEHRNKIQLLNARIFPNNITKTQLQHAITRENCSVRLHVEIKGRRRRDRQLTTILLENNVLSVSEPVPDNIFNCRAQKIYIENMYIERD